MEYITYNLYVGMAFGLLVGLPTGYVLGCWRIRRFLQRTLGPMEQQGIWCDDEYEAHRKKVLETPLPQ